MTKFCFLAILALAVMSCNSASKTTVGIHVDGAKDDVKAAVVTKDSTYIVALDSTGSAVVTLAENLKPGYATLNYGRVQFPVYVEPGKSFDASIKIEARKVDVNFTGEGAKKNEYLNNKSMQRFYPDFKADEAGFLAGLKEQETKFNALLDSMKFDDPFTQLEKKRIHYMVYSLMPNYPSYHPYYSEEKDYQPSDNFFNELKAAVQEEEALIDMPEYQSALTGFIGMYSTKDLQESGPLESTKARLNYVNQNISSPVVACFLVDKFATDYVGRYGVDAMEEITPIYNSKVTCPEKKAKFDELCAKWAKIAKGQPSPSFKCLDINGNEVSLADLAGKYVYIDVWATWCGPCRGEIPHLKKLEHKYKGKNIHFVSISCDQDKAAWEKMVKEDKLEGIQLHFGKDQSFMDEYMIRGIPRFILLDREGKIIESNATRPSNPKTVETFNALEGI